MQTKLTLRLDDELIDKAKHYSKEHGYSVSQLVAEFFARLTRQETPISPAVTGPITHSLRGVLKNQDCSEEDYRQHLDQKYQ